MKAAKWPVGLAILPTSTPARALQATRLGKSRGFHGLRGTQSRSADTAHRTDSAARLSSSAPFVALAEGRDGLVQQQIIQEAGNMLECSPLPVRKRFWRV